MDRKKQELLRAALMKAATLGPLLEDLRHWPDEERGTYMLSFTALDLEEGLKVRHFELPLDEAYWYLKGAVNGVTWYNNVLALGARGEST
jgi:hypothetical protein